MKQWPLVLALAISGCNAPALQPTSWVLPAVARGRVVLDIAPPRELQATARAWRAGDVFEYVVSLRPYDAEHEAFVDPPEPMEVTLAQKPEPALQAVFEDLEPDGRYEATIVARGNEGGTAADTVLNAVAPAKVELDLSKPREQWRQRVTILLDPRPFAATLLLPSGAALPRWVTRIEASLIDPARANATMASATYTPSTVGPVRFENVRGDRPYTLALKAFSSAGNATTRLENFKVERVDDAELEVTPPIPELIPPTGTLLNTYSFPGGSSGIAIDANDHIWVTNQDSNKVTELSTAGQVLNTYAVKSQPRGIAVNRADGTVWVANFRGDSLSKIVNGAVAATIDLDSFSLPSGIAVGPDGHVWVGRALFGDVLHLDASGAAQPGSPITTGAGAAVVAVDPETNDVWVSNANDNTISRVTGGAATSFAAPNKPGGLAIAPDHTVWVATTNDGVLRRYNPDGTSAGPNTTLISGTSAVAIDPDTGAVWVGAQFNNGASKVTSNGVLVGHFGAQAFPAGVAIDSHHHVWVTGKVGSEGRLSELAP